MREFPTERLIIATHNHGKLREFQDLLGGRVREIVAAGDLDLPEPEENGESFAENALIKAHAAAKATGEPALADDSGLCVTALGGQPGVWSARWGGPEKSAMAAMQRVQDALGDAADRSAHFMCVLALVWPDGYGELYEGRCDGTLIWPPRGAFGHGYDPMFVPRGETRSFAEMTAAEKHRFSHRGAALQSLLNAAQEGLTP